MKNIVLPAIIAFLFSTSNPSDDWLKLDRVTNWSSRTGLVIENPHGVKLENVPVIVDLEQLSIPDTRFSPGNFYVYNHQSKKTPLFQVDVAADGNVNEIVFLTSLEPGQQKKYYIYYTENGGAWPQQERYTQATNMPGWESELFGYRSYGPLILDLFARNNGRNELMLHRFYDADNRQIFNYHEEQEFGLDILHIGPTAGLAGVGVHRAGKTILASASFKSEVIASGPVRSIVRMQTEPWENAFGTMKVSRTATIYAHHFETQIEDRVSGEWNGMYAVGIGKVEDSEIDFNKKSGLFLQWHNQGEDIGETGVGVYTGGDKSIELTEDERNHFLLVEPPVKEPLRFWAFGAWKRGENIESLSAFRQRAERIAQLQLPVKTNVGEVQYPSSKE